VKQLYSHWTDFNKVWHWSIFRKSVEKIQISLKPDENNRYFTWRPIYIFIISRLFLLRMKNISEEKLYRKPKNTFYAQ
jgi:hypothetical protein